MKINKSILLILLSVFFFIFQSCKKDSSDTYSKTDSQVILTDFSVNVVQGTYNDLSQKAITMKQRIIDFNTSNSTANLNACRDQWKATRSAWEHSEGFLFGPVSTDNIDPRIDTWPVDYNSLDSVLNSMSTIDAAYINGLDDALKGFHPIEYLLWGVNSAKQPVDFTSREMDYLLALSENIITLTSELALKWQPGVIDSFYDEFVTAGEPGSLYSTRKAAFEEMVLGMAGICDEVANGKITEPFVNQDPGLEESPFAKNSIYDFTHNIQSVRNVYYGSYINDGKSIKDFVRQYNISLDNEIEQRISSALSSLNSITLPFGEAIIAEPVKIQQAIDAINALGSTLEEDLIPLVQEKIRD